MPVSVFFGHATEDIFPARVAARLVANYQTRVSAVGLRPGEEFLIIGGRETWGQTTL